MTLLKEKVEELERLEILSALRKTRCVKSRAALILGISERMFNYRLKKYGIEIRKEGIEENRRSAGFQGKKQDKNLTPAFLKAQK